MYIDNYLKSHSNFVINKTYAFTFRYEASMTAAHEDSQQNPSQSIPTHVSTLDVSVTTPQKEANNEDTMTASELECEEMSGQPYPKRFRSEVHSTPFPKKDVEHAKPVTPIMSPSRDSDLMSGIESIITSDEDSRKCQSTYHEPLSEHQVSFHWPDDSDSSGEIDQEDQDDQTYCPSSGEEELEMSMREGGVDARDAGYLLYLEDEQLGVAADDGNEPTDISMSYVTTIPKVDTSDDIVGQIMTLAFQTQLWSRPTFPHQQNAVRLLVIVLSK